MYTLLSGLYQYMMQKPTYRVLIVGLDGAGKTTFFEQTKAKEGLRSMKLEKIPPTIGLNFAKIERKAGEFTFWDVGGQNVLRKIWDKYYSECNAVIFMIDGCDHIRFEEVSKTLDKMYSRDNPNDLVDLPLLFLVNKKDSPEFRGLDAVKQSLKLNEVHCTKAIEIKAISAFKSEGIDAALEWVYEHVPKN